MRMVDKLASHLAASASHDARGPLHIHFAGPSGVGKTHLAHVVARALFEVGAVIDDDYGSSLFGGARPGYLTRFGAARARDDGAPTLRCACWPCSVP